MEKIAIRDLGPLTDGVSKELTIVLNELKGQPDLLKMATLITELQEEIDIVELERILPFTPTELSDLVAMASDSFPDLDDISEGDLLEEPDSDDLSERKEIVFYYPVAAKADVDRVVRAFNKNFLKMCKVLSKVKKLPWEYTHPNADN